jgi:predicted phage-related endonuclease
MILINEKQGSDGWNKARLENRGASEAPIMAGKSKYQSRDDLLKLKKTGVAPEVNAATQSLFDRGHCAEEAIRPLVEDIVGEDLFPAVGKLEGTNLLASFDGLTMMHDIAWEHKLWNQDLAAKVSAIAEGKPVTLDEHYTIQMDQQLLVSGAEKVIFVTSDGTPEKMAWCWYETTEEKKAALIAGWAQFEKDLAVFDAKEESVKPVAASIPSLPALVVQINGAVTSSNLAIYKATAMQFIENINTDLQTEQDFADAENTVKFCKNAADELKQVKKAALSQTASIEELFRTVDDLTAAMDEKRLYLSKLVKTQKESLKFEILQGAKTALEKHWTDLVSVISRQVIPVGAMPQGDFAGAMRNKKNIDSIRSAVNDELARAKIECKKVFDLLCANATAFDQHASKHKFLFRDIKHYMLKSEEDFAAIVISRISEHEKAEASRRDAEREAIRRQEEAKAQAAAKAEQEAVLAKERAEAAKAQALLMAEQEAKLREEQAEAARQAAVELEKMRNEMRMQTIAESVKAPVIEEAQIQPAKPTTFTQEINSWVKSKGLGKDDAMELVEIISKYFDLEVKAA